MELRDVLPKDASYNARNRVLPYVELEGQGFLAHASGCVGFADLGHEFGGQLGKAVAFATRMLFESWLTCRQYAATFGIHVVRIGLHVAEKEMVGAYATADIAVVEYPSASGNRTEVQRPGHARRQGSKAPFAHVDGPVTLAVQRAYPQPTAVGLLDLAPEAFF